MEVIPIGSITIFTNVSENQQYLFNHELSNKVSATLAAWVDEQLARMFADEIEYSVEVLSYRSKTGCIITPVIIGIVIKIATTSVTVGTGLTVAGVAAGTYKFITDYDKIKKNLRLLVADIKKIWVKVTHRKKEPGGIVPAPTVEIYQSLPDDMKKTFAAGQVDVIISETEVKTIHKTCIQRDDIQEEITKETIEKKRIIKQIPGKDSKLTT